MGCFSTMTKQTSFRNGKILRSDAFFVLDVYLLGYWLKSSPDGKFERFRTHCLLTTEYAPFRQVIRGQFNGYRIAGRYTYEEFTHLSTYSA